VTQRLKLSTLPNSLLLCSSSFGMRKVHWLRQPYMFQNGRSAALNAVSDLLPSRLCTCVMRCAQHAQRQLCLVAHH
jgi:hypothetical protein